MSGMTPSSTSAIFVTISSEYSCMIRSSVLLELKREREREIEWEEKDRALEAEEPKPVCLT